MRPAAAAGWRARRRHRGARLGRAGAVLAAADADRLAADERADLVGRERLVFEQPLGDDMQLVDMFGNDRPRRRLAAFDQPADSSSITLAVASERFLRCVTEWPRKTSSSFSL